MQPAGSKFIAIKTEAVREDVSHNGNFLLCGIAVHGMEYHFFFRCNRPCGYSQAKLDIGFDFAGVECAVEKPEFYGTLGKVAVKIYSMIACLVVVLVTNAVAIPIVCAAVPDLLSSFR